MAGQEVEETVFIQAGGQAMVLWDRGKLAADAGIDDASGDGFGGIALAHNVRSPAEVDGIIAVARRAGARRDTGPGTPPATADTRGTSPIRTVTCGRSPTTRGSTSTTDGNLILPDFDQP